MLNKFTKNLMIFQYKIFFNRRGGGFPGGGDDFLGNSPPPPGGEDFQGGRISFYTGIPHFVLLGTKIATTAIK